MTDELRAKAAELTGHESWPGLDVRSAAGCRLEMTDGSRLLDLSAGEDHLLGYAHPAIDEAVRDALGSGLSVRHSKALGLEVVRLLRAAFPGAAQAWLCDGHGDALRTAFLCASGGAGPKNKKRLVYRCHQRGTLRGGWVRANQTHPFEIRPYPFSAYELLEEELREHKGEIAAVVLDEFETAPADRVRAIAELARRWEIPLIIDEWYTAFRLAKAGWQHELGVNADLTVIGGGLAGGLPFGAVVGVESLVLPGVHAQPVALAAARATLEVLAEQPVCERLAAIGERWRTAFGEACAEHDIHARLQGSAADLRLVFDGQENADRHLMGGVFREELRKARAVVSHNLHPCAAMSDDDVAEAEGILRHVVARMRTLLIEHNSYLSGGLDWVFPGADTPLAERGLAIYRFPATAEVDVVAESGAARISFHSGDLGEVTSSGFYVPTRVRGDFTATASYSLTSWQPGDESASFALFAQNEASSLRYYAQRRSAGSGPHELLANFNNDDLSTPRPVTELRGALRVQRRGQVVSCWHRADDQWVLLGEHSGDAADDVIIGSKIWSSGTAGPLAAELVDLVVDGEIPVDQLDAVPIRPDPRHQPR